MGLGLVGHISYIETKNAERPRSSVKIAINDAPRELATAPAWALSRGIEMAKPKTENRSTLYGFFYL